jgi:hypothetical protein
MTTVLENNSRQQGFLRSALSRSAALQQYRARAPIFDLQAATDRARCASRL